MITPPASLLSARHLQVTLARRHDISLEELASARRRCHAIRRAIMREIAAAIPDLTLRDLGRMFGDRDHAGVGVAIGRYPARRNRQP